MSGRTILLHHRLGDYLLLLAGGYLLYLNFLPPTVSVNTGLPKSTSQQSTEEATPVAGSVAAIEPVTLQTVIPLILLEKEKFTLAGVMIKGKEALGEAIIQLARRGVAIEVQGPDILKKEFMPWFFSVIQHSQSES